MKGLTASLPARRVVHKLLKLRVDSFHVPLKLALNCSVYQLPLICRAKFIHFGKFYCVAKWLVDILLKQFERLTQGRRSIVRPRHRFEYNT